MITTIQNPRFTCQAVESFAVGYDETVECICNLPRGHAGSHSWSEA